MNHKKILIGLFVFLAIAVVLLFVSKAAKDKKDKAAEAQAPAVPAATQPAATTPQAQNSYPIVYNKYSEAAKPLQSALGVTADGIIGAITLKAINEVLTKVSKPVLAITFKIENAGQLQYLLNAIQESKTPAANPFVYGSSWLNYVTPKV